MSCEETGRIPREFTFQRPEFIGQKGALLQCVFSIKGVAAMHTDA